MSIGHFIAQTASVFPPSVKKRFVNLAFRLDQEQFQTIASERLFAPEMRRGLEFLRSRGFNPESILDIGAFEGDWAKMALGVWPSAHVTMIEANSAKSDIIRRKVPGGDLLQALLGPDQRKVPFFVMESGSSVLEENSPLHRQKVELEQQPLDSFDLSADLIKIDVQGYELEVLKGGKNTLSKAEAVIIELSLIEINKGCPLVDEALSFMRKEGFVAYDIVELHRRPLDRAMNQIDVLFLRENHPIRADKRHY